ncbi:hypothetical protein POM88_045329 [Heracleum sosnowskyi]|uniref:Replication factor A C-terminal domain-containing protein n=1 Tax=Heracleum sosnowskyi TaxID=360622 RepID=A0AAD8M3R7_9APIA|nr:hypothetical protein POM88_045329 [Heracleum sosnowskyi]
MEDLEEPVIVIIASAKVSSWRGNVKQLRKKLEDPNFNKHDFSNKRKIVKNYGVCRSCYEDVQSEEGKYCCQKCPREVLEPIPRFKMNGFASDETGVIEIVIKDREIRSLLGNNFEQFEIEDKDYPKIRELLLGKDYTMKLLIKDDNIKLQDIVYEATYIFLGFNLDEEMLDPQQSLTNMDSFTGEPSGSSYNLDEISQLNNQ